MYINKHQQQDGEHKTATGVAGIEPDIVQRRECVWLLGGKNNICKVQWNPADVYAVK